MNIKYVYDGNLYLDPDESNQIASASPCHLGNLSFNICSVANEHSAIYFTLETTVTYGILVADNASVTLCTRSTQGPVHSSLCYYIQLGLFSNCSLLMMNSSK